MYKTEDGNSTYRLGKEGDFALDGKVATPGGSFDQHVKGRWAVNGDRFLFNYNAATVPYTYKLEGNRLALALTGSMKKETVLIRQ